MKQSNHRLSFLPLQRSCFSAVSPVSSTMKLQNPTYPPSLSAAHLLFHFHYLLNWPMIEMLEEEVLHFDWFVFHHCMSDHCKFGSSFVLFGAEFEIQMSFSKMVQNQSKRVPEMWWYFEI
uniref:Uncharacterized protein n=1 Tax=Opuntia streptacantha TaxID=393608 RepID=A0A7C9AQ01_OPUST